MAFPSIPTVAGSRILFTLNTAGGATKTFPNLSSLTKNAGDLLLAIIVEYDGNSTNAEFSSWGGGFTEVADRAGTTTMAIGVAYKFSTGSETGTFTVTTADTSANDSVLILMSIPGAHPSAPPEVSTMTTGTGAAADHSALTPSWGSADTLWISVMGGGEDSTTGSFTGATAAPGGFGSGANSGITADVVGGVNAFVSFAQEATATQDAAGGTVDTTQARNAALTIAVRPPAAAITVVMAETEANDTADINGLVSVHLTMAETEANDTADINGTHGPNLVMAETEANDTADIDGTNTLPNITLAMAETEANDTANIDGTHTPPPITGTMAETEANDTADINGTHGPNLVMAETEANDTADINGTHTPPPITGTLAEVEANDIANIDGGTGQLLAMAEVEANDTANIDGTTTLPNISVTLGAVEGPDQANLDGTHSPPSFTVTLAGVEADDQGSFLGVVGGPIFGVLATIEAGDVATLVGLALAPGPWYMPAPVAHVPDPIDYEPAPVPHQPLLQ